MVLAALAWSTAGVLQRALTLDTSTQIAGRAIFAVTGLLLYIAVSERRGTWRPVEESGWFRAYAVADPDALVKTFVFEIL